MVPAAEVGGQMARRSKESRIPVGTQFSPELISLPHLVAMLVANSGDREAIGEAIVTPPVRRKPYSSPPTRRMTGLPVEAAVQYGLLERGSFQATALTGSLAMLGEEQAYRAFARHILHRLGGLRVVQVAQEMYLDGSALTGDTLAQRLTDQGFRVTIHNTAINTMRMWLAKAGLFQEGRGGDAWRADRDVLDQLVGVDKTTLAALAGLNPAQVAFAEALARLSPEIGQQVLASDVRDLVESRDGIRIGRGSLPNEVLRPLADAGLIEFSTKGTRGGKASVLWITPAFKADVLLPILENTLKDLDQAATAYAQASPAEIKQDLMSDDAWKRGKALEAYVVFVMRLLGLRFVGWRRRSQETANSEVDVLMEGVVGAMPTTWQVQCKNTPSQSVRLEDIAREVGLLPLTRATHILVVANARFTSDARRYAEEIMRRIPVAIFLLDGNDFATILDRPESLGRLLLEHANHVRHVVAEAPLWRGITGGRQTDDE